MKIRSRIVLTLVALGYVVWATATQVRHYAGSPDTASSWLTLAPAVGCILTLLGLMWEWLQGQGRQGREVPRWREVNPVAIWLQYGGFLLLSWRAVWMFFSWDGMFLFPAWCWLALALYRWHPRWIPAA